ncbi:MAG: hypothetical protein J6P72_11030 [Firmicutes bacterium]|nr:hypothetical protein [Bacillota bacterium]
MSSQNFEQLISTYHTIFVVCGIIAIVLLVAAIVLFILLKIPQVFNELSGRGAKKGIAEITESGASGALTSRNLTPSGKVKEKTGRTGFLGGGGPKYRKAVNMTEDLTSKMGPRVENPGMQPPPAVNSQIPQPMASGIGPIQNGQNGYAQAQPGAQTEVDTFGSEQTGVLDNYGSEQTGVLNDSYGAEQTGVLFDDLAATTQLSAEELPGGGTYQGGAYDETTQLSGEPNFDSGETTQLDIPGAYGEAPAAADTDGETSLLGTPVDKTPGFTVLRTILEIHTDEVIS